VSINGLNYCSRASKSFHYPFYPWITYLDTLSVSPIPLSSLWVRLLLFDLDTVDSHLYLLGTMCWVVIRFKWGEIIPGHLLVFYKPFSNKSFQEVFMSSMLGAVYSPRKSTQYAITPSDEKQLFALWVCPVVSFMPLVSGKACYLLAIDAVALMRNQVLKLSVCGESKTDNLKLGRPHSKTMDWTFITLTKKQVDLRVS